MVAARRDIEYKDSLSCVLSAKGGNNSGYEAMSRPDWAADSRGPQGNGLY